MNRIIAVLLLCLVAAGTLQAENAQRDWAGFDRYVQENDSLKRAKAEFSVVFLGNSITQGWREKRPFFAEHGFVGRGISGQTSSEMLVRMRQDVIALHPKVVVILAGTNDIAQNNGFITLEHILGNIQSMCELAKSNGIQPVLCSLVPVRSFYWNEGIRDVPERVQLLNTMIRAYAEASGIVYVDYWSAMAAADGGLRDGLSNDGVHPNDAGYAIMEPLILRALEQLTGQLHQ